MALPSSPEARVFYRASGERFTDARTILETGRTTAAVYLAGYAVECILKALILASLPAGQRVEMVKQFRGSKAHDYAWLKQQYRAVGGPQIPADVIAAFVLVDSWGTELRYNPRRIGPVDAEEFLTASDRIVTWADQRM